MDADASHCPTGATLATSTLHVLFTGGGTLGHVTPALAVAERLRARIPTVRLTLAGPGSTLERRLAREYGIDYAIVPAVRWPRRRRLAWRFIAGNAYGLVRAAQLLRGARPHVVVGLGGFASAPVGRAASLLGMPLVLMEQNTVLGAANRWLLPRATTFCPAFHQVPGNLLNHPDQNQIIGAPVRAAFRPAMARARPSTLLILGGSQGAPALNEAVPLAIARNSLALRNWRIIHQTGDRDQAVTQAAYRRLGLAAEAVAFVPRPETVLPSAEFVVSRSGGATLAELAATHTPAILVPWARSARGHQQENAQRFATAGAALLVNEDADCSAAFVARIADAIGEMLREPTRREAMRRAMSQQATPDAADRIAAEVIRLAVGRLSIRAA